jgi:LuxR family quorum sensing-dependent transcriptional regulator
VTTQPQSASAALRITPRERQALQLLASGQTTTGVAAGLGMGTHEIDTLLDALFATMGAASRAEAVAAAQRRGLLA